MVAATGTLINPEALALLQDRIAVSTTEPSDIDSLTFEEGTHTFEYVASEVTDFAWFVDPAFRVAMQETKLSDGRTIPAYAFYQAQEAALWSEAAGFIGRAAAYADSLIGAYPYPQITAVSAPLGVGGGMEYPMITVIGKVNNANSSIASSHTKPSTIGLPYRSPATSARTPGLTRG